MTSLQNLFYHSTEKNNLFTIPKILRIFFKFNRSLLSELCVCGKEAFIKYLKVTTEKDITPGIIAVI